MTVKEIVNIIEAAAPLSYQESYDNAGLIIGDADAEVSKALICLDLTLEVMQEAIEKNCKLVIAHHPVIFNPLKKIHPQRHHDKIIVAAIKNDVAVYAAHTNLDNVYGGINTYFANSLGLKNIEVLRPVNDSLRKLVTFCPLAQSGDVRTAICEAGAGHIGDYDFCTYNMEGKGSFRASDKANPFVGNKNELHFEEEVRIETIYPAYLESRILKALFAAHPYEEVAYDIYPLSNQNMMVGAGAYGMLENPVPTPKFLQMLKEKMQLSVVKHSSINRPEIQKVALCGGAGSFLLNDAIKKNADIFISAEFKHNHFVDLANSIIIADIGHYESEHFAKELIYQLIIKKFPNFAVEISQRDVNPVNYFF